MSKPKLGLVTVLYNTPSVLNDFFYSLSLQDYTNYHLYVIDNSTSSESLELSKALSEKYSISCSFIDNNGNNLGVAEGNNQGIKAALEDKSDYILLLNNDLLFDDESIITNLVIEAEKGNDIISPVILSYPGKKIWYAGGYFNEFKGIAPHLHVALTFNSKLKLDKDYSYAPTCFLLISKNVFDKIGYMDKKYFAYYDDTDFLYRAYSNKYFVRLLSSTVIYHKVSVSTGGALSFFGAYYLTRNRIYFCRKNLTLSKSLISISYTVFVSLIKLINKNVKIRKGILKGLFDGFRV